MKWHFIWLYKSIWTWLNLVVGRHHKYIIQCGVVITRSIFKQNIYKRQPIACPSERGMGVFCGSDLWSIFCLSSCYYLCIILLHGTRYNRLVSQMQAPQGSYDNCARSYMFLNIKRMLHLPTLWYFDTSVTCPQRFCRVIFVAILPRFV